MFMATFTYMTVVKACNISHLVRQSDDAVTKVIRYGYKNNLHSKETERISQNIGVYTSQGIEAYRQSAKVRCSDAESIMRTIIQSVQQIN